MRKLRVFVLPESEPYGIITKAHFEPIEKHLPPESYERAVLTDARRKAEANFKDDNIIRVSFTLGDFWPAIFITHGMADKGLQDVKILNRQIAGMYPGPAYVSRLMSQGASATKLKVIGYPLLDKYFEMRMAAMQNKPGFKVVWAPTHAPRIAGAVDSRTAYGRFDIAYLRQNGFDVVTNPHPHNQRNGLKISADYFYDANVVISDTSSVIYEALSLGIPVVLTKWLIPTTKGIEHDVYSRPPGKEVCWLANSPQDLLNYLIRIRDGLGQGPGAGAFMEGIFPAALRGCSGKKAADTLLEYL